MTGGFLCYCPYQPIRPFTSEVHRSCSPQRYIILVVNDTHAVSLDNEKLPQHLLVLLTPHYVHYVRTHHWYEESCCNEEACSIEKHACPVCEMHAWVEWLGR